MLTFHPVHNCVQCHRQGYTNELLYIDLVNRTIRLVRMLFSDHTQAACGVVYLQFVCFLKHFYLRSTQVRANAIFPTPRTQHVATVIGLQVFMFGGQDAQGFALGTEHRCT